MVEIHQNENQCHRDANSGALCFHLISIKAYSGSPPSYLWDGVKHLGHKADHSPPFSIKAKAA